MQHCFVVKLRKFFVEWETMTEVLLWVNCSFNGQYDSKLNLYCIMYEQRTTILMQKKNSETFNTISLVGVHKSIKYTNSLYLFITQFWYIFLSLCGSSDIFNRRAHTLKVKGKGQETDKVWSGCHFGWLSLPHHPPLSTLPQPQLVPLHGVGLGVWGCWHVE